MAESKILIKNIYYMLTYAFRILNQSNYEDIAAEDFEYIQDLFATILSKGISQQIKQGLYREYIPIKENIGVLRGKLNIESTIKNKIQRKHLLSCEYDEMSENNIFNQILKFTSKLLIRNPNVKSTHKADLKKCLLFFENVNDIDISSINWSSLIFHKNNQNYKMLMNICYFIIDGMLISQEKGSYKMANFIDDQKMCKLYEKFILEYYRYHYKNILSAEPKQIEWNIQNNIIDYLPTMQTDITLQKNDKSLIIDAKYYNHVMQQNFNTNTIHSANLYQIFTYVKNMDVSNSGNIAGMLLYAKTNEDLQPDCSYIISNNPIFVKTLDLNMDFKEIANQLNQIVISYFKLSQ